MPISFLSPNKVALKDKEQNLLESDLAIFEAMRQPREQIIRASELFNFLQNVENKKPVKKDEYKWKGHSWMIADSNLIQSFQRPQDDVRQVFKCF